MAETFLYLTTIGRVTGKPHKIEIWYVPYEACFYLCNGGDSPGDWVKNLQKTPEVEFYVSEQGQDIPTQPGVAAIVDDEALLTILRQKFNAKYNWSNGTFIQICPT